MKLYMTGMMREFEFPVSAHFMTVEFRPIPEQWEFKAHPEGQPYYRSRRGSMLYLTEADVSDSEAYGGIEQVVRALEQQIETDDFEDGAEVLLEWIKDNEWSYYMVKHESRSVFWVHPCDCNWLTDEIGGVKSKQHFSKFNISSTEVKKYFAKFVGMIRTTL